MLNTITSLSVQALADDMLNKIKACWSDPFTAPVVVFPDANTEQWFKLHVLQTHGVLMNLNMVRLESFLFGLLKTDERMALLSPDMLRDAIIQKLLSTTDGVPYISRIKHHDNIGDYLNITDSANEINYTRLFDFANDLSRLFIDYEVTRPGMDAAIPDDDWQRDLYNAIMDTGVTFNQIGYFTCAEMAQKNRAKNNGKIIFRTPSNKNVFVFGFSGMGQIYRNLLKQLGNDISVYVYLHTPEHTDNTNDVLRHWATAGNINHRLFAAGGNSHHLLNPSGYNTNTNLGRIQDAIARDAKIDTAALNTSDDSIKVVSAPSKIKEVEIVHTAICNLLKDKKVVLRDILVLAPDINDYKSEIAAVFDQVDPTNTDYPAIPTSIVDFTGKSAFVSDALDTLCTILRDGGLTRGTFFAFIKNLMIQYKYEMNDTDVVDVFQSWIENLRIYRSHTDGGTDDWHNGVIRMLAARLTNRPIQFKFGTITPFADFQTEDDAILTMFARLFYDIKDKWIGTFGTRTLMTAADIDSLRAFLADMFAPLESGNSKFARDVQIWRRINRKLDQYTDYLTANENSTLPRDCVLMTLTDIANNTRFDTGAIFTHGVTFTSLLSNRTLPAKYIFVMGMNSENFPGANKKIILDRREHKPADGDDDIPARNKNAFFGHFMAAGDALHISFVDRDMQTNNTFYPACVLNTLEQYANIKATEIGLDERRKWAELYTPRERRNKRVYMLLNNPRAINDTLPAPDTDDNRRIDLPDVVTLTQLRYFMENPLKCYTYRSFGFDEDDTATAELEDIELNEPAKIRLQKSLIKPLLSDASPVPADFKDILPDGPFARAPFTSEMNKATGTVNSFKEFVAKIFNDQPVNMHANYPINLRLNCEQKAYTVTGEIMLCAYTDTDIAIYFRKKDFRQTARCDIYALIATLGGDKYTVHVLYYDKKEKAYGAEEPCTITRAGAIDKLNAIYKNAFIDGNKKYIPYPQITGTKKGAAGITSLDALKAFFNDAYNPDGLNYKKMLDPDKNLGFSAETFLAEFIDAFDTHDALIQYPEGKE